ncbi:sporulation protein YqfC [Bacillus altitudinis]|uniref:sporulation protein YqfC n=1 Tax=Bacillus altitudinis TaxID=293387 RepID=UPI0009C1736E|nr:sporulation protein YqfC [Bacillus altitudinis]OQP22309.1 sporulation protein YqfC [Bacillus stratosphericus]ATP94622.1 sporulation protein YqfC [Bacillus altitudinis]MDI6647974.1 sporulation protein YqfC [Bacillus altitudinis]MDI6662598.1 sporulation protein YqfC [Bacillus altitudinis]WOI39927.1 sporulation protein YqfC [Bacillus altitudinis]
MGKRKNRLKAWLTRTLEIPPDVMMDLPRITMVGRLHIYIENHKGLLLFSDQEVRLMLKQGQCIILGKDFVIKTILPEEILLEGKIDEVRYIDS